MKKHTILLLALVLGLVSCNQDLLNIDEKGVVEESDYYATDDDALSAITVVYNTMKSAYVPDFYIKNLLSNDAYCGGGSKGDRSDLEQLNEFSFSADNSNIKTAFSNYYQVIKYANVVIEKFPEDSETNTDVKDQCRAEAKMARAWAHLQLTMLWGTPPLVDHVLSSSDDYKQPNSAPEVMWNFIMTDLTEAAAVLPSKSSMNEEVVRFTKEAALSLKGKAQIFSGDYAGAKTTLKKVIDSGLYGLVSDMTTLFNKKGDYCEESMIEMNNVWDASNWNFSLFHLFTNPRADKMYIPSISYARGYGFFNPTDDFYNSFIEHDGDSHRLNSWIRTWDQMMDMEYANDQSGLKASFIYAHEGYFDFKYFTYADEVPAGGWGYYCEANFKYMRYAEVLLLYAEVCVEAGDSDGSGLAALNEIQSRAGAPETELTLENVKKESRYELWLEGTQYVNLVRWGDAATELADQGAYIPNFKGVAEDGSYIVDKSQYVNTYYGFKSNKHELLPFPEAETIVNSNIVQNPGWTNSGDE